MHFSRSSRLCATWLRLQDLRRKRIPCCRRLSFVIPRRQPNMPKQDPSSRRYVPSELWGDAAYHKSLECYIAGSEFVLGPCSCCDLCDCVKTELVICSNCEICLGCGELSAHGDAFVVAIGMPLVRSVMMVALSSATVFSATSARLSTRPPCSSDENSPESVPSFAQPLTRSK